MSSQAYGVRVLRWILKVAPPSITKCVPVSQMLRSPCSVQYRSLCSAQRDQGSSPITTARFVQHPGTELSLQGLAEMGFSEAQARAVYEDANKSRCKSVAFTLAVLFGLGLNPDSVAKILDKCPELYCVHVSQLQQRVGNLRKLGLVEGSFQRVISYYPQLLCLPVKRVNRVTQLLRERCQFSAQQVTEILRDSPAVVREDPARVEYLFQYVYFRMGCGHLDMLKAKLFRFSLAELQCRHGFLERRGLYQTPDKKGQTLILNPPLKDILTVSEETYLTKVATATKEEFDVFRKLLAREQEEDNERGEGSSSDDDDDDDEEEEEEDVHIKNHSQNSGYNQRNKQHRHK